MTSKEKLIFTSIFLGLVWMNIYKFLPTYMEILVLIGVVIVIFWIVAVSLIEAYRQYRLARAKARLKGRIVKISKTWLRDHKITGENFGKIYDFPVRDNEEKLVQVYVQKLISKEEWKAKEKELLEQKEHVIASLESRLKAYKEGGYNYSIVSQAANEVERAKNTLISVPSEGESYSIPMSAIRLMPRNYDYVTGGKIQLLKVQTKGGVKNKKSMGKPPKFLRVVMWAFVAILVCSVLADAAWHVNDISNFVVTTLILHKK